MILVFDVGNSETTIGLFNGEMLRGHWRIITSVPRTADEFGILIGNLVETGCYDIDKIDGVAIGSVVPAVTGPLLEACSRYLPASSAVVVDASAGLPIKLDVDEPMTVGPTGSSIRWPRAAPTDAIASSSTSGPPPRSTASPVKECSSAASSRPGCRLPRIR